MPHRPAPPLRFAAMCVALLLLCAWGASAQKPPVAPAPAPGSLFLTTERFVLEDGGLGTAERGLLFVPQNRSVADSPVLSVEVFRFAAKESAPADAPPIFILNGGPGYPGLQSRLNRLGAFEQRIEPYTEIADVVILGQRGIGSSWPNTVCENAQFVAQIGKECSEFWSSRGIDLKAFSVIEAAADVRDAAAALGYEQIVIEGGSFGSHWGMTILQHHPDLVSHAVLHGMEGPNHTYDDPRGVLNALERMAAAAEASPRLAGHIPDGGLIAGFERALDAARKGPATATVEHPESGEEEQMRFFLSEIAQMAYGTTARVTSRGAFPSWPADMIALARGDFRRVAKTRLARSGGSPEDRGTEGLRTASFFMLDCGSGITAERLDRLKKDPATKTIGNLSFFYEAACSNWDADLGDAFRTTFATDVPTAIVQGNWDVSTPYENALELAPSFENGKLVTVDGGSHGAYGEALELSESFREALMTFLRTGQVDGLPERVELPEIEWEVPE